MITTIKQFRKILESNAQHTLVVCDVQPEYEDHIKFDLHEFAEYVNETIEAGQQVVMLYNGRETLGMIDIHDYMYWLTEIGVNEEHLDSITFYDKGYGFFREMMGNFGDDDIQYILNYLKDNNIHTTQEFTEEQIAELIEHNSDFECFENGDVTINIPDLESFIRNYNNFILVGGGMDECLKECEILFDFLQLNYNLNYTFTY